MAPGKCFGAAQVENDRIVIDELHSILRFDIDQTTGLAAELGENQQKKAEKQCRHQQCVIGGEFQILVHEKGRSLCGKVRHYTSRIPESVPGTAIAPG